MGEIDNSEISSPENRTIENNNVEKNAAFDSPNAVYEVEGSKYCTDDNSELYKIDNELCPSNEYTLNDVHYKTDADGQITEFEGTLKDYNPDNERDEKAQLDVGGEDRLEKDDGGHLIARVFNGSQGVENMVPMRDTVNRGDYKSAENEISEALKDNKEVYVNGEIIREDPDTSRPTKLELEYQYEDTEGNKIDKVLTVDNVKGSTELFDGVKDEVSEDKYAAIENDIAEMQEDGHEISVTSVTREYDEDGNIKEITVKYKDETEGERYKKTITP